MSERETERERERERKREREMAPHNLSVHNCLVINDIVHLVLEEDGRKVVVKLCYWKETLEVGQTCFSV